MKSESKWLWLITIIAVGLVVACDNGNTTPDPCAKGHAFPEWIAPTCEVAGNSERVCERCGVKGTRMDGFAARGHDMQLFEGAEVILAPTCTQNGIGETACAHGCGKTEEDGVLPALGHHHVATGVVHTAATCTTAGSEEKKCDNLDGECGDIIAGEVIPALTHLWIDNWVITKQPTCTTNGDRYRVCDRLDDCEERQTQLDTINVHALDHDWKYDAGATVQTCTAAGSGARSCQRLACGATSTGGSYPALDHLWIDNWEITKQPTCTANGDRERECNRTGCSVKEIEDDTINVHALDHDWKYDAGATVQTCTQAGSGARSCQRVSCGATSTGGTYPALGHLWIDNWEITKQPTCLANGDRYRICDRFDNCEERQTELDTINLKALGHEWLTENWVITKHLTCLENGDRERECNHTGCSVKEIEDDTENLPAYGSHRYLITPVTCTTASIPHNCDRQLQRVGQADYICGDTNPETVVPALGHLVNSWNWVTYNSSNGHVSCYRDNCSGGLAAIGDTGSAGGIIFYVAASGLTVQGYSGTSGSFDEYTAYYLEAAPANARETQARWSSTAVLIPNLSQNSSETTDRAIGRGRMNTAIIIAAHSDDTTANNAAKAAAAYTNGGKTDWFLPSIEELNQMYIQRSHVGITTGRFWSSSQHDFERAQCQEFGSKDVPSGTRLFTVKASNVENIVRAIRAF